MKFKLVTQQDHDRFDQCYSKAMQAILSNMPLLREMNGNDIRGVLEVRKVADLAFDVAGMMMLVREERLK
jgi:hypothetical protein